MNLDLRREPLRDQIYDYLRERIVSGELEPGKVIRESELAETFDVSRTPVREALLALRARDFLSSPNGKGFVVPELDREEGLRLYRTMGLIESAILRKEVEFSEIALDQLRELTQGREVHRNDPKENLRLDHEWHRTLLAPAARNVELGFLAPLRDRLLRYGLIYVYSDERVSLAVTGHREIEDAIEKGMRGEAADLLEEHWQSGIRLMQELDKL